MFLFFSGICTGVLGGSIAMDLLPVEGSQSFTSVADRLPSNATLQEVGPPEGQHRVGGHLQDRLGEDSHKWFRVVVLLRELS